MNRHFLKTTVAPTLAAAIWGTAFVGQSVCAEWIPPFTFNALRSAIACALLFAISRVRGAVKRRRGLAVPPTDRRGLWLGGALAGVFLAAASNLQQAALIDTAAGKAGFITALYVVLVPLLAALLLRKRAGLRIWVSIAAAVAGLWLLCVRGGFALRSSDLLLLLCALMFAGQILSIDRFSPGADGIRFTCVEFFTAGVLSAILAALWETPTAAGVLKCVWPLLYVAVFSSGVAYTLQVVAQREGDPTLVSLLMSLESVFAVLGGAVILGDRLTGREYLGCALMFAAVVLAQLPGKKKACSPAEAVVK